MAKKPRPKKKIYAPKPPAEIRALAHALRRDLGIQQQHAPDLAHLLNRLSVVYPKFRLKIVKDTDLPEMEAKAYSNAFMLKVREGVMSALRTYGDVRARFTVAHELGHLLLGHPGNQPRGRPGQTIKAAVAELESEANTFASEFLMPPEMIDPALSVEKIARLFQVSNEAAARRRRELNLERATSSKTLPAFRPSSALVPTQIAGRVAFVSMAFSPERMTRLYLEIIRPAVEACGLTCLRADEISSIDTIVNDIRRAIDECEMVVAEISESNLNVMHEIGLAQSIDKPVIVICRSGIPVPSNISALRRIVYSNDAGGGPKLRRDLEATIRLLCGAPIRHP